MRYTTGTSPPAIREPQLLVDRSAPATPLRRGVGALYLAEHYAALLAHVAKNPHELAKGQVGDLLAPEQLHTLEVQIFDADEIKRIAELMGGLEEPIPAFPGNAPMGTGKATTGLFPVPRPLPLSGKAPVESADLLLLLSEKFRGFNLTSIA